jgi:hypothetical protein
MIQLRRMVAEHLTVVFVGLVLSSLSGFLISFTPSLFTFQFAIALQSRKANVCFPSPSHQACSCCPSVCKRVSMAELDWRTYTSLEALLHNRNAFDRDEDIA